MSAPVTGSSTGRAAGLPAPAPRRLALAVGAVTVALGASACSGIGGGDDRSSSTGGTTTSGGTPAAPRESTLDERTAIASRPANFDDVSVRFDLISLRRSGSLATLRFTATNTTPGTAEDTDKEWSVFSDLASGPNEYSVNGVYLVDPAHSKRYPTATDSADDCVCSSTSGVDIVPTRSREFSATFAAPPADVATVDVYVPGAGTFENVPVS